MIYKRRNKRDGIVRWFIRYDRPDGRRITELGGYDYETAKAKLIDQKHAVNEGEWKDPHAEEEPPAAAVLFEEFAERFLREDRPERRSDFNDQMVKALKRRFTGRPLKDITAAEIDRYKATCALPKDRGGDGVGPSTTRKRLVVLGRMLKMARRWGVIEANPAADLEKPAEP